jgi:hypothetical protein
MPLPPPQSLPRGHKKILPGYCMCITDKLSSKNQIYFRRDGLSLTKTTFFFLLITCKTVQNSIRCQMQSISIDEQSICDWGQ